MSYPDHFTDAVAEETWERTAKLIQFDEAEGESGGGEQTLGDADAEGEGGEGRQAGRRKEGEERKGGLDNSAKEKG